MESPSRSSSCADREREGPSAEAGGGDVRGERRGGDGGGGDGGGGDGGDSDSGDAETAVADLVAAAEEMAAEMRRSAGEFARSLPARPTLYTACLQAFHSALWARLAPTIDEAATLEPMDLLMLITWAQDYGEKLDHLLGEASHTASANAPRQLLSWWGGVQRQLIAAYAAHYHRTWGGWLRNLHVAEVERLVSEHRAGPDEETKACNSTSSMAPVDLLSMLNAPFTNVAALQVPALTNALVAVCAEVIVSYAAMQRQLLHTIGHGLLHLKHNPDGGALPIRSAADDEGPEVEVPNDGRVSAHIVCAVLMSCSTIVAMLTSLVAQIDLGISPDRTDADEEDGRRGSAERGAAYKQGQIRLREGYLFKQPVSSSFGHGKRRWLVLRPDCIEWYTSEEEPTPKGSLLLTMGSVATLDDVSAPAMLTIKSSTDGPQLVLRAEMGRRLSVTSAGAVDGASAPSLLTEWHGAVQRAVTELANPLSVPWPEYMAVGEAGQVDGGGDGVGVGPQREADSSHGRAEGGEGGTEGGKQGGVDGSAADGGTAPASTAVENLAALPGEWPLPLGDQVAKQALARAKQELERMTPSAIAVLAAISLYRLPHAVEGGLEAACALALGEHLVLEPASTLMRSLHACLASSRWFRARLHPAHAARLEHSLLQMLVAHALETLLVAKAPSTADLGGARSELPKMSVESGWRALKLLQQMSEMFEGVDPSQAETLCAPLRAVLDLTACPLSRLAPNFAILQQRHPDVGSMVAAALLPWRSDLSRAESEAVLKAVAGQRQRLREGYLFKQPVSSSFGQAQRRWLVLRPDCIEWYTSEEEPTPKGSLLLTMGSVATLDDVSAPAMLTIKSSTDGPQLVLRAEMGRRLSVTSAGAVDGASAPSLLTEWHGAVLKALVEFGSLPNMSLRDPLWSCVEMASLVGSPFGLAISSLVGKRTQRATRARGISLAGLADTIVPSRTPARSTGHQGKGAI